MTQKNLIKKNSMKIIFLACFIYSCIGNDNKNINSVKYRNELIKPFIVGFLKSLSRESQESKMATVSLHSKSDTFVLSIANSFPDLSLTNFNGVDSFNNYRIFFVGEKNYRFYLMDSTKKIPTDIVLLNKNLYLKENKPPNLDPKLWIFYFKENNLIDYYPKEEIESYISAKYLKTY